MNFDAVWEQYKTDMAVAAFGQTVPGLDYDDVVSEMGICLWRATQTYDPDCEVSFGAYWWSLWLNRKADLVDAWKARKRVDLGTTVPLDDVDESDYGYVQRLHIGAPEGSSATEALIWDLLSAGFTSTEVRDHSTISLRRYYATIARWRTKTIHDLLTC